tara:strand:- start:23 stop:1009 length:987 start_codon:yes stop_codon:yes gene_type:complete
MGLLKKAKGFVKKTVRKVVPKELSGIMTAAAPFVAPFSLPAAAALSIGGQLRTGQGRINPILTTLSLLPGVRFQGGQGLGALKPTGFTRFGADAGTGVGLRDVLFGGSQQTGLLGSLGDRAEGVLFGTPGVEASALDKFAVEAVDPKQGILGFGGEFGLTKGNIISTVKDGAPVINKAKVAGLVGVGLSLTQINNQIETEGADEGLTPSQLDDLKAEAAAIFQDFNTGAFKPDVAEGGLMRANLAMGSKPTPKESGLGGLPIEADMRYTGGFMPYGAREKADDVPARLSKNEFVFTADAVRAAGGGNINKGARRMYNTMKQLESMGRA